MDQSSNKNWIFLAIIGVLAGLCIYLFLGKNKEAQLATNTQTQLTQTKEDKETVQTEYNAALSRLDDLKSENKQLDSLVNTKNAEVEELKTKITNILNNKNATDAEIKEAKKLITSLNKKVDNYVAQIISLKKENAQLTTTNNNLNTEKNNLATEKNNLATEKDKLTQTNTALEESKKQLENTVTLAKVLSASNITLSPIKKRWLTGVEANTNKASRAEKVKIQFDLNDNRVVESGDKNLYIVVYNPNGDADVQGSFKLKDGTEKKYTTTKTVAYTQGTTTKNILLEYVPLNKNFDKGEYLIEIYHNGYLIGSNKVSLK